MEESRERADQTQIFLLQNIHGKHDGEIQEKIKMRKKVKQINSQNPGKEKLASCKLSTAAKTHGCQPLEYASFPLLYLLFIFLKLIFS